MCSPVTMADLNTPEILAEKITPAILAALASDRAAIIAAIPTRVGRFLLSRGWPYALRLVPIAVLAAIRSVLAVFGTMTLNDFVEFLTRQKRMTMTIQQIITFIKNDVETLARNLGIIGKNLISSIDFGKMEHIAQDAFLSGGISAVIPALIANVSDYVSNPYEAALIAIALRFAAELLGSGSPAAKGERMALAFSNVIPPTNLDGTASDPDAAPDLSERPA